MRKKPPWYGSVAMEMFNKAMRASDRRTTIHTEIQTPRSPSSISSHEELFYRVSTFYSRMQVLPCMIQDGLLV